MKREPVGASSNIKAVGYDPATAEMEIEFALGSVYVYKGVPESVPASLKMVDSPGKYFVEFIKGQYPCEKRT